MTVCDCVCVREREREGERAAPPPLLQLVVCDLRISHPLELLWTDRQAQAEADRHAHRHTYSHTDIQTDRWTVCEPLQTDRETGRQTLIH